MTPTPLLDWLPACQLHSDTSRAAAREIRPSAKVLRETVFDFIHKCERFGATDEEQQAGTGLAGNTQRPRRRELELENRVFDSGRTRATSSGRQATVWVTRAYLVTPEDKRAG